MSRGPHPQDPLLFSKQKLPVLKRAAEEVSWLLGRDYSYATAVAAAGNHHQLKQRQRVALSRSCASDEATAKRLLRKRPLGEIRGKHLSIDGFNLIIALEVALAGGPLFAGREGALRDLAGLWGTYHLTDQTRYALSLVVKKIVQARPRSIECLLDERVSNSGRLRKAIEEHGSTVARQMGVGIDVKLVPDPDPILAKRAWVVSADRLILDQCGEWINLAREVIERSIPSAWIVDWWG